MPQPKRMPGTVFHADSNYSCLRGDFIKSPSAVLDYPSERKRAGAKGRRFMKRQLTRFRRNDGKRWLLEGMADAFAEPFDRDYQPRLDRSDAEYDDWLSWEYDPDPDYDCWCCRPEPCGCPSPEEHDYWSDRDEYYNGSDEDRYQQEQSYLDWMHEVHQEYLNGRRDATDEGYRQGYEQARRDMEQKFRAFMFDSRRSPLSDRPRFEPPTDDWGHPLYSSSDDHWNAS